MPKKTYQELLKENLNEFDTTQTVDVKGPMLDPILGYEGDGELPTYKDAASVLEKYYFGEKRSEHEISEMDYENDKGNSSGESMKDAEGPEGEEQAGTSKADTTTGAAKEKEKDIVKEDDELAEKEMNTADLKSAEMKDADGPEGEEQAGTGDTYKEFKKRVVESIEAISEGVELNEDDDKDEDEDKDEDKDEKEEEKEEMEESKGPQAVPAMSKKSTNEDSGEEYEDDADAKGVKEGDEIEVDANEEDITEALENEIIEKLISEMEEEGDAISEQGEGEAEGDAPPEKDAADDEGGDEGDEKEDLDVDKKMEEMVNRLTSEGSMEKVTMKNTEGPEGEEQAGTGDAAKEIPPRKDRSDEGDKSKGVKPMDKGELADA